MKLAVLFGCILAIVLAVMAQVERPAPAQSPRVVPLQTATKVAPRRFQSEGAGSCSARACHGGLEPSKTPGSSVDRNEYTTWVTRDRHARAYQVLVDDPRSSMMIKRLGWSKAAYQEDRCLVCHSTPLGARPAGTAEALDIRQEGVSCEACHGSSSGWIGEHTKAEWKADRADPARSASIRRRAQNLFGMLPTYDLADRALTCAGCHVGSPANPAAGFPIARSVDHDMIAAGHPRLTYEFSAYYDAMPHHWRASRDAGADFSARAWMTGQIASSRTAIALLQDRAKNVSPGKAPWPEFAEYDCYACHHALRDEPWRREHRRTGWPAWGTWTSDMTVKLADDAALLKPASVRSALDELHTLMSRPAPQTAAVATAAGEAVHALDGWLDRVGRTSPDARGVLSAAEIRRLIEQLDPRAHSGAVADWDHASQTYMALAPLLETQKKLAPSEVDPSLVKLLPRFYEQLRFPPGFDSPARFDPSKLGRER